MGAYRLCTWWVLASVLLQEYLVASQDQCYGPLVDMTVISPDGEEDMYGVLAPFGATNVSLVSPLRLLSASPLEACGPLSGDFQGAAVLVERGTCSFLDKAWYVQQAKASAMVLFNNNEGCITMGYDAGNETASNITIPLISLTQRSGSRLLVRLADGDHLQVQMQMKESPSWDPSLILLWVMAVGTVVGGSIWSGRDHTCKCSMATVLHMEPQAPASSTPGGEVVEITMKTAVGFVAMASCMLLLLFFFLNKFLFYVLLFFFSVASIQSLTVLLEALICTLAPSAGRHVVKVPAFGPCQRVTLCAFPVALVTVVVWAVFRNSWWAWVLQDLQGIALMLLVMRTLRLSSLRVACVLLPLCFLYDVFWVFIEPLLFGGGTSVMVQVAKGGSSHEFLPMLLRVPRMFYHELGGYSMLGFGDIILPGVLVAFTRRLDLDRQVARLWQGYFLPTCVGYSAGLLLTYCALIFSWFGDQGQPALLYLVPCTLGMVLVLGWVRGELQGLLGNKKNWFQPLNDHDSDAGGHLPDDVEAGLQEGGSDHRGISSQGERASMLRS